ncbi:Dicer [Spraguea lophii 42_110]|uniref:Dicer n=1 Tax=Spraguea lophii (strain 42_110) TaxID=1358809 RepID=S7XGR6_SPRLO|nr:Dicer [Spraguea lophii 42_110]
MEMAHKLIGTYNIAKEINNNTNYEIQFYIDETIQNTKENFKNNNDDNEENENYNNILIIVDDKDTPEFNNINDYRDISFKSFLEKIKQFNNKIKGKNKSQKVVKMLENINFDKNEDNTNKKIVNNNIIITVSKFLKIVLHGLLDINSFSKIIIKSEIIRKELITGFKYFYFLRYKENVNYIRKIQIILYTAEEITENIKLYFNILDSQIEDKNKENNTSQFNKITSSHEIEIIMYTDNNNKFTKLMELVNEYDEYKIYFLKTEYDPNENILFKITNIHFIKTEDEEEQFINSNNIHKNFTQDKNIKNDFFMNRNNILIIYDNLNTYDILPKDILYHKTFYFQHKGNSYTNLCKLRETLFVQKVNEEKKTIRYIYKDNPYIIKNENDDINITYAVIPFGFSALFLDHILIMIKDIFESQYLYIKDISKITINYREVTCDKTYEDILNIHTDRENVDTSNNNYFICLLSLPPVHSSYVFNCTFISTPYSKKRDAQKDVAIKIINEMVKCELIDNNFIPDPKTYLENNKNFKNMLLTAYHEKENINLLNYTKDYNFILNNIKGINEIKTAKHNVEDVKKKIKKKYSIFINKENINHDTEVEIDVVYRKIPKCLNDSIKIENIIIDGKEENTVELYCYLFKNKNSENTGILCNKSFIGDIHLPILSIYYLGKYNINELQMKYILFYQITYFSLYCNRKSNMEASNFYKTDKISKTKKYNYLMVPIKDNKINFQYLEQVCKNYLISNVFKQIENNNLDILYNNILFNPFTKQYYIYGTTSEKKMTDKISMNYKKSDKKNKKESLYTGYLTEEYESSDEENEIKIKNKTYYEYFEEKYNIRLIYKDAKHLMFKGFFYIGCKGKILNKYNINSVSIGQRKNDNDCKIERKPIVRGKVSVILSSEILHVTNFKITELVDFHNFMYNLYIFESVSLAEEYRKEYDMDIDLMLVMKALTHKNIFNNVEEEMTNTPQSNFNYERLEFLGDTIFKYLVSQHYFLSSDENNTTGSIVDMKCEDICNKNLYSVSKNLGIEKYMTIVKYHNELFQTPSLEFLLNYCEPFKKEYVDKNLNKNKSKNLSEFIEKVLEFFDSTEIFQSKTQHDFLENQCTASSKNEENTIHHKKIFADVVEALVGGIFLTSGLENTREKLYKMNILKNNSQIENIKLNLNDISEYPTIKKLYENFNLLKEDEIKYTEEILKYQFKNKSLIEKAMIHTSYNIEGRRPDKSLFHKLELIGDAILDLVVTMEAWLDNDEAMINYNIEELRIHIKEIESYKKRNIKLKNITPEDLHTYRRKRVNNNLLGVILYKLNLFNVMKTHKNNSNIVEKDYKDVINNINNGNKISKMYGDILEAICGAILIDCNFNVDVFYTFYKKVIKNANK